MTKAEQLAQLMAMPLSGMTYDWNAEVRRVRALPDDTPSGRKDDNGKPRWSLLPWRAVGQVVEVLEHGARKYGADNWRKIGPQRYREALHRHWAAWAMGELDDKDTGLPHLAHAACNILFLLTFDIESNDTP